MANHPNMKKDGGPGSNPRPEQIRAARLDADLTQKQAAELIWCSERTWQDWECKVRRMHPAFWLLFKLRVAGKA